MVGVHAGCNWLGLPRVWGRVGGGDEGGVRGKEDGEGEGEAGLGVGWSVAYYAILIAGAVGWWRGLWVLTEGEGALVKIG